MTVLETPSARHDRSHTLLWLLSILDHTGSNGNPERFFNHLAKDPPQAGGRASNQNVNERYREENEFAPNIGEQRQKRKTDTESSGQEVLKTFLQAENEGQERVPS